MHGRILGYLYWSRPKDVYQKDIEEHFNITRSSVAGIVKLMEQKGYILRQSVQGDARLKKLCGHAARSPGCRSATKSWVVRCRSPADTLPQYPACHTEGPLRGILP